MGQRGPAPTPTPILKLRGSPVAKQRTKGGEPQLPVERPACPAWLPREAKAEWNRQVKQLERMGVLAKVDRAALAAFCEAWAELVHSCWVIENGEDEKGTNKGAVIPGSTGSMVVSPWVRIKNAAVERMTKLAAQFGFTPSARTRVKVSSGEESKGVASRKRE